MGEVTSEHFLAQVKRIAIYWSQKAMLESLKEMEEIDMIRKAKQKLNEDNISKSRR